MTRATSITTSALAALATVGALVGCGITDPYSHASTTTSSTPTAPSGPGPAAAQNTGESPAPAPPTAQSQAPSAPEATPEQAINKFALLYVNWTWRTLPTHLRQLAALSVGAARLSEQQAAAAASRDSEITTTHVFNRGQIVSIAPNRTRSGEWVIVTREQTGGNAQYDGLQPSWHVTLAHLAHLPNGYAITQWRPQN
jgi:hypothetical protein